MRLLFLLGQYLLPQHLLSRLAGKLASSERVWLKNLLIRRFVRRYDVDLREAEHGDPEDYASFNAFFTRALRPGARPLADQAGVILSPADGCISAIGNIDDERIFQAKGHDYSLTTLLGGDEELAQPFRHGQFATVYLSPRDYHRVHCPLAATLREMLYVPGRLFSVNQTTAESVPGLFARNERVVCLFDTAAGQMAVVLVGAMIVAGIETVWAGQVAPSRQGPSREDYRLRQPPLCLAAGAELGRFKLGSTVILLFGTGTLRWRDELAAGSAVRMGECLGTLP